MQTQVTAQAFAAKYSNKVEVYRFLSTDCGIYLPSKDTCTIWFLRGLADGTRTRIRSSEVRHLSVPQFEGLSVEKALTWVANRPNAAQVMRAFPEEAREIRKLPRQWINNVIYTLDEEFKAWVDSVQDERVKKLMAE